MMETDIEEMYLNLNELLEDICKFFSNEKLGVLSPKDKKLADSLIARCKKQLQEISKIQQLPTNEEYVDMDVKKVIEEEEGKNNIYSSVDDNNTNTETTLIEEGTVYPYKDLPARDASQEIKYGAISMRRKFLLGFEKMKRVYASIHNQWLIIYCSERDVKPIYTFDLRNYEAKEADSDKSTNFELMSSTSPDRKIYYFMASTRKDMLQWVVHINRCHDIVVLRSKGINLTDKTESTDKDDDISEHYDSVRLQSEAEEAEDDIYLELDEVRHLSQNNNTIIPVKNSTEKYDDRPPLPGRRPLRALRTNMSIPVAPPVVKPLASPNTDSEESLASYDDIGSKEEVSMNSNNISLPSFEDSFSDDDEDTTYEAFVNVKDHFNRLENKNQASQIDTDHINITNVHSNPPEVPRIPVKPVVAKKPLNYTRSSNNPRNSNS